MNNINKLEHYIFSKKDKFKISSQDIKKGDIFLALQGKNFHGNKFIKSSLKKGAKFCITNNVNFISDTRIIYIKNIFKYLTDLATKKRNLYKGKVIGITGSAGKTTLKETLAFFLKKDNLISYSQKSYNNELGVLISLLNLNLNSSYAIFEIGTNNFGEIKYLTNLVRPEQIFITNIQSTHLENFKTKNKIATEKSDIFVSKYNNKRQILYLNIKTSPEEIILKKAKKEKNLKIIRIDKLSKKYFVKNIIKEQKYYKVIFSINKKIKILETKSVVMFRIFNLLFCYAFFDQNSLNLNTISKRHKLLKPIEGRGLTHSIFLNKIRLKVIDESYNANPDTMYQSLEYFSNIKKSNTKKILIFGNMNELGTKSLKIHLEVLLQIERYSFKMIILCGEFFRKSIKKLNNPRNKFIYSRSENEIMNYLKKNIHNDDIIMVKCSNSTIVNKFTKNLLKVI